MLEVFKNQREFNIKFPSKLYICTRCNAFCTSPYYCKNCGNQCNNFFLRHKNYRYKIKNKNIEEIFPPAEYIKNIERFKNDI